MLLSALIKVKSWDVAGQEGDMGGSPCPRQPHALRYTRAQREENQFEELEDARPRRHKDSGHKSTHGATSDKSQWLWKTRGR